MRPTRTISFRVPEAFSGSLNDLPHGELLTLAVNPFNGLYVLSFQDNSKALDALDCFFDFYGEMIYDLSVIEQESCGLFDFAQMVKNGDLLGKVAKFERCSSCHQVPTFDRITHSLSCGCDVEPMKFSSFEQALEVWNLNHKQVA